MGRRLECGFMGPDRECKLRSNFNIILLGIIGSHLKIVILLAFLQVEWPWTDLANEMEVEIYRWSFKEKKKYLPDKKTQPQWLVQSAPCPSLLLPGTRMYWTCNSHLAIWKKKFPAEEGCQKCNVPDHPQPQNFFFFVLLGFEFRAC
jgi:hypothetical protein